MLVGLVAISSAQASAAEPQRFHFAERHMGTTIELVLYAADEATANRGAKSAYARFAQLDATLSDYDPHSELSRLSATAGQGRAVPVGRDLWAVLTQAQQLAERTDGAFDVTVGPIIKLWRRARRSKQFPPADALREAQAAVGFRHLILDAAARTATLDRPGMRLDLGGIAMGYACDEALALLREQGITRVLIDGSGDIVVGDPPPGAKGWRLGIMPLEAADGPPSRYLELANAAVTTSGDAFQHVVIDGRRYSHIVDPHTGLGLTTPSAVTVVARDCITADSLATAVCVLGPKTGLELVEHTPGTSALFVTRVGDQVKMFESSGFPKSK